MATVHDSIVSLTGVAVDAESVGVLNEPHTGVADKNKNISHSQHGTSKEYRLAKLKRDFGEEAVLEAAKKHKTVSALERHFGVGKPLLTAVERLEMAFNRTRMRFKRVSCCKPYHLSCFMLISISRAFR